MASSGGSWSSTCGRGWELVSSHDGGPDFLVAIPGRPCDPEMMAAAKLGQTRPLLTDSAQELLYDAFQALVDVLGSGDEDLMIPAVVWLRYMRELNPANGDILNATEPKL